MPTKTKAKSKNPIKVRSLDSYIVATTGTCGGRPRIEGRRITVQNIVTWHDRMGMTADQIADEYDLRPAQIYAAMAYYFDHREEIDQRAREDNAFVKAFFKNHRSPLQDQLAERGIAADDPLP